jgi:hypothetical protein
MIGQYLPNNNEKATVHILQKKIASKPAPGENTTVNEKEKICA